jgi:hypothetical protein
VEFALLAWLLFAILFLTIEVGIWSSYQSIITSAARDSAMHFAITENAQMAIEKAKAAGTRLSPALDDSNIKLFADNAELTAITNSTYCNPGQLIKVRITYPRSLVSGFGGFLNESTLPPMVAESAMVCE